MTNLLVDCPTGLSGDMLLAAFIDLGVSLSVINSPLEQIGLQHAYSLKVEENKSFGLRGLKVSVQGIDEAPPLRRWKDIRALLTGAPWQESLRSKVFNVFEAIANQRLVTTRNGA